MKRKTDSQPGFFAANAPTNYSNAERTHDSRPLSKNRSAYPGQILASKWTLKRSLEGTNMGGTISGALRPGGIFTPSGQRTHSAVPANYRKHQNYNNTRGRAFPSHEFDSKKGMYGAVQSRKGSEGTSTLYKKHSAYQSGQGTMEHEVPTTRMGRRLPHRLKSAMPAPK